MAKFNIRVIALARTLLALSTLMNLLFNPGNILFTARGGEIFFPETISLFHLLENNLLIAVALSVVVLALVISGYWPRITAPLHYYVAASYFFSAAPVEGGDQINMILCLFLIPVCWVAGMNNHWKKQPLSLKPKSKAYDVLIVCFVLIQIQAAYLYFDAFVSKLWSETWTEGTALYYFISDPVVGANVMLEGIVMPLLSIRPLTALVTWSVLLMELTIATALFWKRDYRPIAFVLGFFLHSMIWLVHGLASFSLSMTALLILYLWDMKLSIKDNLLALPNSLKRIKAAALSGSAY